jgi:hypothetical protein
VSRYFFHSLDSFLGRKPPCYVVLFVRIGIGVALHVFTMVSEIFSTMLSSVVQASCHWSGVRWLWFSSKLVSSFSCVEFASKNYILKFSKFSSGIGLTILVGVVLVGGGGLPMSMFWGMCKETG